MSALIPEVSYEELAKTASGPGFAEWLGMVKTTGGCAEPIHLWGESQTIHAATGEVLARREPGRLLVACGNRRASRCPSCSETYRSDAYQLIRAGLVGGKGVPDIVREHPKLFVTFTAPSFGPVHHHVAGADGQPKLCHPIGPSRCTRRHPPDDPVLGRPLDPDSYDYVGAVIWNALATRLWARTVQLVNRKAAALLGVAQRNWGNVGRVSVAKVAEFQARGAVHFHATFRLDGPEPGDTPPAGATVDVLSDAVKQAAGIAQVVPPASPALDGIRPAVWGEQLDVRSIHGDAGGEELSDTQVAGYIAKYSTKGAEVTGALDRPLFCRSCQATGHVETDDGRQIECGECRGTGARESLDDLPVAGHVKAMIKTCWELGGRPELARLRLRHWAHMLGFRGHFLTKTRGYSTTFGCLRGARRVHRQQHTLAAHDLDPETPVRRCHGADLEELDGLDEDTVLVVGDWVYAGRGHTAGEAVFAATVASDLAESQRIWRQIRPEEEAA